MGLNVTCQNPTSDDAAVISGPTFPGCIRAFTEKNGAMTIRQFVPWYARIAAKVVLSRLPAAYAFWHRHNLFSHGFMDQPVYARDVFRLHFERSSFARKGDKFVGLELGPGDSIMSAVIAAAYGARTCYLIDAGSYSATDARPYHALAESLRRDGLPAPDLTGAETLEQILVRAHAQYGTQGMTSLRAVPTGSVDFVWSHAVLEHIRRREFGETMRELRRVLRGDGVCSHRVDLKDHLGGTLNNLRLRSRLWERDWMARSGFYTNRIRYSEMVEQFAAAGFSVEVINIGRWSDVPISRSNLATEFQHLSDDDLCIKDFDVLLRPT
jgi:SAM-dependent methyltransferase